MRKLGVVIPWDSPFCWKHAMENMLNWTRPAGYLVNFFFGKGWCPSNRHNNGVMAALKWGADMVVFAGGDHIVEREVLVKLLHHIDRDGWDMATGITPLRGVFDGTGIPFQPIAYKAKKESMPLLHAVRMVYSKAFWEMVGKEGPSQEIHGIGTGTLACKKEVFETLEKPWFKEHILENSENFARRASADVEFVMKATLHHGFRLWLDVDIDVRHLEVFPIDETYSEKFKEVQGIKHWNPVQSVLDESNF